MRRNRFACSWAGCGLLILLLFTRVGPAAQSAEAGYGRVALAGSLSLDAQQRAMRASGRNERAKEREEQARRCQQYLDKMKKIQAKLRKGYREPEGNKLREQRRELSQKYQKECQ